MEKGGLVLKANDERRIEVLIRVEAGLLSATEAAGLLGVSDRQARRLAAAYRAEGPRGVVHGNRGRPPAHALPQEMRDRVRALATGRYAGVNHTHLAELLAEREGLAIAERTLRRVLAEASVRPTRTRRPPRHRSRREASSSRSTAASTAGSGRSIRTPPWSPASTTRPGGCPAAPSAPRMTRSATSRPSCRGPAFVLGSQAEQFLLDLGHAPRFALEVIDPVVEWSPPRRMPNKRAICSTIGGKR